MKWIFIETLPSTLTSATSISAPPGSTGGTFADLQGHAAMANLWPLLIIATFILLAIQG